MKPLLMAPRVGKKNHQPQKWACVEMALPRITIAPGEAIPEPRGRGWNHKRTHVGRNWGGVRWFHFLGLEFDSPSEEVQRLLTPVVVRCTPLFPGVSLPVTAKERLQ